MNYHDDYMIDAETLLNLADKIELTDERLEIADENSNEGQFPYFITEGLPFVIALFKSRDIDVRDVDDIEDFCEENDVHPEDVKLMMMLYK